MQPVQDHPTPVHDRPLIFGLRPGVVILAVAATCVFGMIWGATQRNWVLVATEIPSVLALVAVWAFSRSRDSQSEAVKAAAAIGLLCAIELWLATAVFDARGLQLAVIVAISTGVTGVVGVGYWLLRRD